MGETGQILTSLIVELKSNSEEKKGFFGKLFGSAEKNFEKMKAQYSTTEANIDRLVKILEGHEEQLVKDIVQLDKLYDKNKLYSIHEPEPTPWKYIIGRVPEAVSTCSSTG